MACRKAGGHSRYVSPNQTARMTLTTQTDYLLSGLMYIPSGRLDAFYTTRISRSLQASISCITEPQTNIQPGYDMNNSSGSALLRLQHDTGRWGTEYTWNSDGGMLGVCVLRNFGRMGASDGEEAERKQLSSSQAGVKRVDEEEAMEGGLKGRVSLGAEFYASAERSAGGTAFLACKCVKRY